MGDGRILGGKRDLLARGFVWSGALPILLQLPAQDSLMVLTYHRVGNSEADMFDPGVFSATGEQFDEQVSYLKRKHSLVTLEEALAFIDGTHKDKTRRCRVLITFDDGYLDNYEIAFPILHSHGVQGVFFLCPNIVGSGYVPWWDHVAFIVKTATRRRFTIQYPKKLVVDIDGDGVAVSARNVIRLYKTSNDIDLVRFIRELEEASGSKDLSEAPRRFLNWDEAGKMIEGGMAIGSHTLSHAMLSKLTPEGQFAELVQSRSILSERLGIPIETLAYPFGSVSSFSEITQQIAEEAGYRAAFSYHRGTNRQGMMRRFDIKRVDVCGQALARFQVQAAVFRFTGSFWP